MPKQQTHIRTVRQWCESLGTLTAVSISPDEARLKIGAYVPMLMGEFPDGAFTTDSLQHVARNCPRGFPTYGELAQHLSAWWREHRPAPPALPPARPAPPPEPREPPTAEEVAYVRARVQECAAAMQSHAQPEEDRRPKPAYLTPEQLDRVSPLPGGRKRAA